jgi:condensin complex subunit 1
LPLLKDKIHNEDVQKALSSIIEQAKRRPDVKNACIELEEKVKELLERSENSEVSKPASDNEIMPPPLRPIPKSIKAKKKSRRIKQDDDESENNEDDEEDCENRSFSRSNSTHRSSKYYIFFFNMYIILIYGFKLF